MLRGTGRLRTAAWRETGENVSSALCVREAKDLSEGKSYAGFAVSEPGQLSAMPVQWQQYTTWPCLAQPSSFRPHSNVTVPILTILQVKSSKTTLFLNSR